MEHIKSNTEEENKQIRNEIAVMIWFFIYLFIHMPTNVYTVHYCIVQRTRDNSFTTSMETVFGISHFGDRKIERLSQQYHGTRMKQTLEKSKRKQKQAQKFALTRIDGSIHLICSYLAVCFVTLDFCLYC